MTVDNNVMEFEYVNRSLSKVDLFFRSTDDFNGPL